MVAVLGVAAGAGLVLLGASRTWWVEVVPRAAPLRPEEIGHTGGSLAPLLPALGLVALAAAGGLLATRGIARRLVGVLLAVVAVAVVVLVLQALANPVVLGWPIACLGGALLVGAAGALAVRDGDRWPVMGSRYGRGASLPGGSPDAPAAQKQPAADSSAALWDALERGEDPTRG